MAQGRRGCGCALAALVVVLAAGGFLGWKFVKPWWEERRARQLPPPSGKELTVRVLDVGLGDSILIVAPSGKSVLIDAGPPGAGKKVLDALKRAGVTRLDFLIATHAHADHVGGADEVLKAVETGQVYYSGYPHTTREYDDFLKAVQQKNVKLEKAAPGTTLDLGDGALLRVLAPIEPFFEEKDMQAGGNEPNANSVVVRLDYGEFSMLLPGDAEEQTERRMAQQNADFAAAGLKVAHHGSKYATSEDFLKRGGFRWAVISTSPDNRYGLPSPDALGRLKAAGVKLYRTDLQGEITINTRGQADDVKITTAREPKAGQDIWAGLPALRDDSAKRGFIDFGDLAPAPKPTPQKANTNTNSNNRNANRPPGAR
ncbi:MAG TPA: ComEC/Rec2 family competence protein [Pyrinomonadaceae bacterium]|nr:ComEC/Rec2 family competence protein [Pyrinomonadaceae bacterium]